jgi:hypothetical protein
MPAARTIVVDVDGEVLGASAAQALPAFGDGDHHSSLSKRSARLGAHEAHGYQ